VQVALSVLNLFTTDSLIYRTVKFLASVSFADMKMINRVTLYLLEYVTNTQNTKKHFNQRKTTTAVQACNFRLLHVFIF